MKLKSLIISGKIKALFFVLLVCFAGASAQMPKKQGVDTFGIALRMEYKKHLYPAVDSLTTNELVAFDGTNFNFWLNEGAITTSKIIQEDGDARNYGWNFAKLNLRIIDDIKKGVFDESRYELYK